MTSNSVDSYRVMVPWLPASLLNRNKGSGRHWAEERAAKKLDQLRTIQAVRENKRAPGMPWASVTLHVTFFFSSTTRRDPDNYVGSLKGFMDGLVHAGVLTDDSFTVIKRLSVSAYGHKQYDEGTLFIVTQV